jgi:mRNA-decapping enzyme subunit 2
MFRTNEELIGRKIEYDGNPQVFANKGFDGIDPHAFRIVGGEFMNSGGNSIAKAPHQSQLQPLFRPESFSDSCVSGDNLENEEDDDLKPFFSDNGATPWGEYVSESVSKSSTTAKKSSKHKNKKQNIGQQDHQLQRYRSDSSISAISDTSKGSGDINFPSPTTDACDDDPINTNTTSHGNAAGLAILKMLRGNPKYDEASKSPEVQTIQAVSPPPPDMDQFFLTDREITARSQNQKLGKVVNAQLLTGSLDNEKKDDSTTRVSGFLQGDDEEIHRQEDHYQYMRNWVDSLPKSEPSKIFGDFHFDVEAIMSSMGATTMT